MAKLSDAIENVLNEARMLLLGGQVLLGFSYRICFEPGFEKISSSARVAEIAAVGITTAALGWLMWPAAFHQIAQQGKETAAVHAFTTKVLDWVLLPVAIGLGLGFYPVASAFHIAHPAVIGAIVTASAVLLWYFRSFMERRSDKRDSIRESFLRQEQESQQEPKSDLSNRIKKVLIECRMALPGAQAFLGFQFAIVFTQSFEQLPRSSQWVHFGSLLATTISIVLLIAPAAYHRLAEGGEDTEHCHSEASRLLLQALVFLGPGMAGDLFVVIRKVTGAQALSIVVAGLLLLAFYGLWFGVSLWKREEN